MKTGKKIKKINAAAQVRETISQLEYKIR